MIDDPDCPVCDGSDWETLGTREYVREPSKGTSPYVKTRLEVLFNLWLPGKKEATLRAILCRQCGFVCHAPRAEPSDISRKYAYLHESEAASHELSESLASDKERSIKLFQYLAPFIHGKKRILDFGGGNGRLLLEFLEHEYECNLVDYEGEKVEGVVYLGSDLADVPIGSKFDLLICSHVMEHLPTPLETLEALRGYLAREGNLYVEVPLEIWKGPPLPIEPVTHINYFTEQSLRILLERAGYSVVRCEEGTYTTEQGGVGMAVRAVAGHLNKGLGEDGFKYDMDLSNSAQRARSLVSPSLPQWAMRYIRHPALFQDRFRRASIRVLSKIPLVWRLVVRSHNFRDAPK